MRFARVRRAARRELPVGGADDGRGGTRPGRPSWLTCPTCAGASCAARHEPVVPAARCLRSGSGPGALRPGGRGRRRRGHPRLLVVVRARRAGCCDEPVRAPRRNVYALVRLADEVVDGSLALERPAPAGELLDRLEARDPRDPGRGLQHEPRRARLRLDRPRVRDRRGAGDPVLRLHAHRPDRARRTTRPASRSTSTARPRSSDSCACGSSSPARGPRAGDATTSSPPARAGSAPRSRRSTSCATWPPTTEDARPLLLPRRRPAALSEADKHRLLDDIDADLASPPRPPAACRQTAAAAVTVAHARLRRARDAAAGDPRRGDPGTARPAVRRADQGPRRAGAPSRATGCRDAAPQGRRHRRRRRRAGVRRPARPGGLRRRAAREERRSAGAVPAGGSADGFRFDTGPSWYLMPDVFDHFFRLLGTTADEQLDLVRLDPAYRVFFEGRRRRRSTSARAARRRPRCSSELEPGCRRAAGRLPDLGRRTPTTSPCAGSSTRPTQSLLPLVRPDVVLRLRTPGAAARAAAGPVRRVASCGTAAGPGARATRPSSSAPSPGRAPSIYHLMSHLDLVDGVLLPAGRLLRGSSTRWSGWPRREGVRIRLGATATAIVTRGAAGPAPDRRPGADRRTARCRGCATRTRGRRPSSSPTPTSSSARPTCTTSRQQLLPGRLRSHSPGVVAPTGPRARRGAGHAGRARSRARAGAPLAVLHPRLGRSTSTRSTSAAGVDPGPGLALRLPAARRPTRRSPRPAPRTSSCSCRCPRDRTSVAAASTARATPGSSAVADAAIAQIAAWAGVPDLADRVVVRRTVGPQDFVERVNAWSGGALGLGAHACVRARSCRPATLHARWPASTTPATAPCPGSVCRCA